MFHRTTIPASTPVRSSESEKGFTMGFFKWLSARRLMKARKRSQPFTLAIADSLQSKPNEWEYDQHEKWLRNEKGGVSISAPQRECRTLDIHQAYGNCNTSVVLAEYGPSWDRHLIDTAYLVWREATALERERGRATKKAIIIVALATNANAR